VEELDKNRLATFRADLATRREEAVVFEAMSRESLRVAAALPPARPVDVDEAPLAPLVVPVPAVDELIDIAMRRRPELRSLEALVRVRRSLVSLQEGFYYPDFLFAG